MRCSLAVGLGAASAAGIFFEDKPGEGRLSIYQPHLHVLFDPGWREFTQLDSILKGLAMILRVPLARLDVHYEYAEKVPEMLHMVKWALRPTFEHWQWDPEMAYRLPGFRNANTWGLWRARPRSLWVIPSHSPVWTVPAEDIAEIAGALETGWLEVGRCLVDDTPITWAEVVAINLVRGQPWADLGDGYLSWTGQDRDLPRGGSVDWQLYLQDFPTARFT